ncbi:MAG: hypothetical protein M9962_03040 [Oligoflexia bacterium]|nr:hypothetical protein [Oligoflexia bacterium]
MKRLTFFLTALLFSFAIEIGAEAAENNPNILVTSQDHNSDQENEVSMARRHNLSTELLGRGGLYSFNYDYLLKDELALGLGISNYSISVADKKVSTYIIPVYANYYFLEGNHRVFATAGTNIIFASGNLNQDSQISGSGLAGVVGGGYEYRSDDGFLFRASPYAFFGKASGVWLGLSFGYSI